MLKKPFIIVPLFLFLSFSLAVSAQETAGTVEVAAEDLGVEESGLFSWLTDTVREVKIFFTFDPIKKSELQLEKASRQIIKAKEEAEENADDPALREKLAKADEKYRETVEKINERLDEFKEENPEATQLKDFLDKYTDHQLLHQQILRKLEERVPEQAMEIIRENRERHLERFGETMNRLQNKEELKERLKAGLEDNQKRIEQRVERMRTIEELEQAAPIIKERIRELKEEGEETFRELKAKREEIEIKGEQTRQNLNEVFPNPEMGEKIEQNIQERKEEYQPLILKVKEETKGIFDAFQSRLRLFTPQTEQPKAGPSESKFYGESIETEKPGNIQPKVPAEGEKEE